MAGHGAHDRHGGAAGRRGVEGDGGARGVLAVLEIAGQRVVVGRSAVQHRRRLDNDLGGDQGDDEVGRREEDVGEGERGRRAVAGVEDRVGGGRDGHVVLTSGPTGQGPRQDSARGWAGPCCRSGATRTECRSPCGRAPGAGEGAAGVGIPHLLQRVPHQPVDGQAGVEQPRCSVLAQEARALAADVGRLATIAWLRLPPVSAMASMAKPAVGVSMRAASAVDLVCRKVLDLVAQHAAGTAHRRCLEPEARRIHRFRVLAGSDVL